MQGSLLANNLSEYLVDFQSDFYPEMIRNMLPLCGVGEAKTYNFYDAVLTLNKNLNLNLDTVDVLALSRLLTELSTASRFREHLHFPSQFGENSAVHSVHTVILINDLFRRAGLLSADKQTESLTNLRVLTSIGCLIHDMGEILGELSSLSQRVNKNLDEDFSAELEKEIFRFAARLVYRSIEDENPTLFASTIQTLRRELKLGTNNSADFDFAQKKILELTPKELSPDSYRRADKLLSIFDLVEAKTGDSSDDLFCAYAVKIAEHIQGTRHFVRFSDHSYIDDRRLHLPEWSLSRVSIYGSPVSATVEFNEPDLSKESFKTTIPVYLVQSANISRGLKYSDDGIGELFQYADTAEKLILAKTIRNASYETTIEQMSCFNAVFDRTATSPSKDVIELQEQLWHADLNNSNKLEIKDQIQSILIDQRSDLISKYRKQRNNPAYKGSFSNRLHDIESTARIASLYKTAVERDYIPKKGEVLGMLNQLPEELHGFELMDWSKQPRWHDRK